MFVLVVDDDEDFLLLARRALESRGHDVETTSAAFGLVNKVAGALGGRRPDVVVLDCELPGLTGFSAIELLARDRRTASVPIVLVSAAASIQHLDAAKAHTHATFMQKDGRMRSLVEAIETHAASAPAAAAAPVSSVTSKG